MVYYYIARDAPIEFHCSNVGPPRMRGRERERERESLGEIFEAAGGQAKSDLVETRIAAKREYRSYENYA